MPRWRFQYCLDWRLSIWQIIWMRSHLANTIHTIEMGPLTHRWWYTRERASWSPYRQHTWTNFQLGMTFVIRWSWIWLNGVCLCCFLYAIHFHHGWLDGARGINGMCLVFVCCQRLCGELEERFWVCLFHQYLQLKVMKWNWFSSLNATDLLTPAFSDNIEAKRSVCRFDSSAECRQSALICLTLVGQWNSAELAMRQFIALLSKGLLRNSEMCYLSSTAAGSVQPAYTSFAFHPCQN